MDWLVDEARRGKTTGGRAAALGEKELEDAAEATGEDVNWDNVDEDNMTHGQFLALVKNTKAKAQKGKGKGKGKGVPQDVLRVRRRGPHRSSLPRADCAGGSGRPGAPTSRRRANGRRQ